MYARYMSEASGHPYFYRQADKCILFGRRGYQAKVAATGFCVIVFCLAVRAQTCFLCG